MFGTKYKTKYKSIITFHSNKIIGEYILVTNCVLLPQKFNQKVQQKKYYTIERLQTILQIISNEFVMNTNTPINTRTKPYILKKIFN